MASFRRCLVCGKLFEIHNRRVVKFYDSNACKQKAYRIAKGHDFQPPEVVLIDDFCLWCKTPMKAIPGQKYCNPACRQAAYRWRKKWGGD